MAKVDDSVWVTGQNSKGQLGIGTKSATDIFFLVEIPALSKLVAAGGYHSMALSRDGRVFVSGWNKRGQLGDGSTIDEVEAVAAGDLHSVVLKRDGSVWATGRNYNGQLGDGSTTDRNTFVQVIHGAARSDHSCRWLSQHGVEGRWQCVDYRLERVWTARGWIDT